MEIENKGYQKTANEKTSLLKNITPKSHLIIEKKSLECIICYDFSINILETSCCGIFICNFCSFQIKDKKCPICKKSTDFIESKSIKRLINNSISVCPFCEEELIFDKIPFHVKEKHMNKFQEIMCSKNSEKNAENEKSLEFLKICLSMFKFDLNKKIPIHNHILQIKLKNNENLVCFFGEKMGMKNCLQRKKELEKEKDIIIEESKENNLIEINDNNYKNIDNKDNNEINEKKDNTIINNKDNKKDNNNNITIENFFEEMIYYNCEICNYDYCLECIKTKEINCKTKIHVHNLSLSNRRTTWGCDGRKGELGCQSQISSNYGYFTDSSLVRYRCDPCDFDLCEKCLYLHHTHEENVEKKNDLTEINLTGLFEPIVQENPLIISNLVLEPEESEDDINDIFG
jgi:hypothetical protein